MYYNNPEEFLERTKNRFEELVEISRTNPDPDDDISTTPDVAEFVRSLLPELVKLSCEYRRRLRLGMGDTKLHIFFGEPNGHALWSILYGGKLGIDKFAVGRKAKVLEAKREDDIGEIVEVLSETIRSHNFEDGVKNWKIE